MITKEIVLDRIEIIFRLEADGKRYPHVHARGKIDILEDGVRIATAGGFRFNARSPDQDAGDQPDAPFNQEKIAIPQEIKDKIRETQQAHVTTAIKDDYIAMKAAKEEVEPVPIKK